MNQKEVIKHSSTIAISNTISLLERKLFNHLLANAYNFLKEKELFSIALADLKKRLGFNSKNSDYFKRSLKKLVSTVVEFNLLGKEKQSEWSATSLLASVQIKG